MVWKISLPHEVTSLECYFFIMLVCNCVMGATPMFSSNDVEISSAPINARP